jgi:hypothetical protein
MNPDQLLFLIYQNCFILYNVDQNMKKSTLKKGIITFASTLNEIEY